MENNTNHILVCEDLDVLIFLCMQMFQFNNKFSRPFLYFFYVSVSPILYGQQTELA